MFAYIVRRILLLIPVIAVVGIIAFTLIHLIPGDPASVMLGRDATIEQKEALRDQLGLDQPFFVQMATWIGNAVQFDFGESIFIGKPVSEALFDRFQPTVLLAIYSLFLAVAIALPSGVMAATRPNSVLDRLLMMISISGVAIPGFFLGILLILLFAVNLQWLPAGGYVDIDESVPQHFKYMILPTITLGFSAAGLMARLVRSTMLDVLHQDYVRTAYAKGLSQGGVVMLHALRNAAIPVLTIIGITFAHLLGGAIVVETVFNIPGMGRLVVQSVTRRDFPLVQGAIMTVAAIQVIIMLLLDVLFVYVDPRVRYGNR